VERTLRQDASPSSTRAPLLVALVGPTASGKTALALALAERFSAEIVNCDSVAVYREFEIGTAKPNAAERARVPHHLLDIVEPAGYFTAGDYARCGREALTEIHARRRMPIVTGGTGLYLRALLDGLFAGPPRSEDLRNRLRERAEHKGPQHIHRILQRLDPRAAVAVHENDVPKVIRAIEVCLATKQRMTELWAHGRDPLRGFRILRIGLSPDRVALYARIDQRARSMFAAGLVEETRGIMERFGDSPLPLSSHGYAQALQHLRGEIDLEGAIRAAQQVHRNYAKRQMTWFRREPDVSWLDGFGDDPTVQAAAGALVEKSR
jgi:tRNA dimethylallyltransferase